MRISDWSSDLFSSDLFTPVQMYPGLETKLYQISKGSYTLARGMRAPETVTLTRGPDRKWLGGERHNYPARQDFVQKVLIGVRSEEHTSELQSLMRISYAVFCLKKKKTQ